MQTPTPLIVRLQELPDLGHAVRATLAVQRLRHVAAAQLRVEAADAARRDADQATDELRQLTTYGERIEEFVPTAEVSMDAWLDGLRQQGLIVSAYQPRRRGLLHLVRGDR